MGRKSTNQTDEVVFSPIESGSPAVYVYVSDLIKSTKWYCNLIGLTIPEQIENLVILRFDSGANIFLFDKNYSTKTFNISNNEITPLPFPLFSLMAKDKDLNQAKEFMQKNNINILWSDKDTFNIQDPDGNVIMICSI